MSDTQQSWATLPVWLRKLPNFWRVAQLICRIETISILRQFFAPSLSCDWSIVCLHMNCWFCWKLLTYYLFYISFNISYFKSKLIYHGMDGCQDTRSHVYLPMKTRGRLCTEPSLQQGPARMLGRSIDSEAGVARTLGGQTPRQTPASQSDSTQL